MNQYKQINLNELKEKLKSPQTILIDVREDFEFALETIPGAINIPVNEILHQVPKASNQNQEQIIVFCRSGARSRTAYEYLKQLGYKNIYDFGSIDNWKE